MTMRIEFDWDPVKARSNETKHGVTFDQAMGVFTDPLALSRLDDDHPAGEERWITLGMVGVGRLCWLSIPMWRYPMIG
jgi:uncharacterized DUF497 family protein